MVRHGSPHVRKDVQKGGPFYFVVMTMPNPYTKPHATVRERIDHLKSKGLIVSNAAAASKKIDEIGYERLRIYFLSRRDRSAIGKPFVKGTTHKDIIKLYECDAKLRHICFQGVGKFEILFRNQLSETLSSKFGGHPYSEVEAFKSVNERNEQFHNILYVFNCSKDERAKHYRQTYTSPTLPPIWILKEFFTFGAAARFYSGLSGAIRSDISKSFGVLSLDVFDSWVRSFVDLRNICAHHDRLFNRGFQKQPQRFVKENVPSLGTDQTKLKAQIECLDFVISGGRSKRLASAVERTLNRYPEISNDEAGF